MRNLTDKELTLISGGDLTTVVVTADPPPPGDGGGDPPSDGDNPGGGGGSAGTPVQVGPASVTVHQDGNVVTLDTTWVVGSDTFSAHISDDLGSHNVTWGGSASNGGNTLTYSDSSQGDPALGYSHEFDMPDGAHFTLGVSYDATNGYGVNGEYVIPF